MEFFEFLWLFSLTVVLPILLAKMVIDYKRHRNRAERDAAGAETGMTLGELKGLLRDTVEQANAPLLERIEVLERRADPGPAPFDPYEGDPLGAPQEPQKTAGRLSS